MRQILATVFLFLTITAFGQNPLFTRTSYKVVNSVVNDTFYIEFQGDSVRIRGNHGYLKTNRLVADSIRLNGAWFKGGINPAGSNGQVQFKNGSALGANSTFYFNSSDTTVFMKNGKLTGYLYLDKNKGNDTTFLATLTNGRVISVPLSRLPVIKAGSGITNSAGTISFGGAATGDMTVTPNSTSVDVSLGTSGSRLGTISLYANPSSILIGSGIALSGNADRSITSDRIISYTGDFAASMTSDNDIPSKKRVDQLVAVKENSLGNPSVDGQALISTTGGVRSWATLSASPGGANTYVQVNNSGSFGGWNHFTYTVNDSTLRVKNFLASRPAGYTTNMNSRLTTNSFASKGYADSIAGTATLLDDILDFQSNKYARYLSKPTGLGLYNASAFPTLANDTVKLNGIFSATQYVYKSNVDGDIYKTEIGESGYFHRLVSEGYDFYSWNQYSGNYLYSEYDGLRTKYTTYNIKISNNLEDSIFLRINPIDNSFTPFLYRTRHKVSGNLWELWQQNRLKVSIDSSGNISSPTFTAIEADGDGESATIYPSTLLYADTDADASGSSTAQAFTLFKLTSPYTIYTSIDPYASGSTTPFLHRTKNKVTGNLFELWQQDRKKWAIDSAGFIRGEVPHAFSKFNDSTITISLTQDTWYQLTRPTAKTTWPTTEFHGFTESGDTVTATYGGHYIIKYQINIQGSDSKTYQYRIMRKNGATEEVWRYEVTGTGSSVLRDISSYIDLDAGTKFWAEIRSTSSAPGSVTILGGQMRVYPIHLDL